MSATGAEEGTLWVWWLIFSSRQIDILTRRNIVYKQKPPLYSIKKGKSQQYIKNDDEFDKVMLKRAADGLVVRYGDGAAKLEGKDLARFMSVLKEYLGFFDKVDKRVRDERVTELLAKLDLAKHSDFEGDKKTPPAKLVKLEKQLKGMAKERGFKSVELQFDDEHNLWQAMFVSSHGVAHIIHWEWASSAESRHITTNFKLIQSYMDPPSILDT